MSVTALANRTSAVRLREARCQWLQAGTLPNGVLEPALQASWARSRGYGLVPDGRPPGAPHASGAQLTRALEQRRSFVAHARPVMDFLSEQISDSGCIVILADAQAMLLHTLGDTGFADKAARVALRPGAIWHEQWRGTNAIGTALAAGTAVVVHGAEHYLERNAFLTCAAAPIVDPLGQPLGVLDISGDRCGYHRHTLGLVRSAARMVEHQLFQTRFGASLRLRLHARPEGIATVTEGLLALSDDGWIVGANSAALAMLGLGTGAIGSTTLEQALAVNLATLRCGAGRHGNLPRPLQRPDGMTLWVRLDAGRSEVVSGGGASTACAASAPGHASGHASGHAPGRASAEAPEYAPADALAALDTGDATMQAAIGRARRVIDKPIALLLLGESGVGKELFARACHGSGPRHGGPFVAVNCAALPETLIEAELFGYRAGAFTGAAREGARGRLREANGGTLFLDEIGDMQLAMQARLLRVLQERQVTPLGGGKAEAVDFQLICATHRRLREEVDAGRFREDLYYRINGLTLALPALRARSDGATLVAAILAGIAPGRGLQLAPEVAAAFARFRWPGNLRQMANVLRTASALLADDETVIGWPQLPDDIAEDLLGQAPPRAVEDGDNDLRLQAERCIQQAVQASHGNMSEAARRLGISRNTLYRRLRTQAPN